MGDKSDELSTNVLVDVHISVIKHCVSAEELQCMTLRFYCLCLTVFRGQTSVTVLIVHFRK